MANGVAVSGEDVDDTRGKTSFVDEVTHPDSGEGSEFGGFEDDGVSGCESGSNFPGQHKQREVPGDDLADDADGFVA